MRFDLCFSVVPVPIDYEKQMLYDLQDFQLGSFDDVFTADLCWRLLCDVPCSFVIFGVACLGGLHYDVP